VIAAHAGHPRAARVLERARAQHETLISCAQCGRQWWAPKSLPPQPGLKVRGEPPGNAPAGRCPSCGKVYCVSCASANVREMRFVCADCGENLKLSEDSLKWLLVQAIEAAPPADGSPAASTEGSQAAPGGGVPSEGSGEGSLP